MTDVSRHDSVTTAVAETIAEARKMVSERRDPLANRLDTDALDSLFRGSDIERLAFELRFTVADCTVVLYGDERVVAAPVLDVE